MEQIIQVTENQLIFDFVMSAFLSTWATSILYIIFTNKKQIGLYNKILSCCALLLLINNYINQSITYNQLLADFKSEMVTTDKAPLIYWVNFNFLWYIFDVIVLLIILQVIKFRFKIDDNTYIMRLYYKIFKNNNNITEDDTVKQ